MPDAKALVIGVGTIDCTWIIEGEVPKGDEKKRAHDYAFSVGGNGPTAGFACALLQGRRGVDMIVPIAKDRLSRVFLDVANEYGINVFPREVSRFPLSGCWPSNGERPIVTGRETDFGPFPKLENIDDYAMLHVDRHQPEAARHYALKCREAKILTSLDAGGTKPNTDELLQYIDVALVSESFRKEMGLPPEGVLDYLKGKGCKIGGVTLSERGMLWYDEDGRVQHLPALVPPKTVDTLGLGDIFRGGYMYSYLTWREKRWIEHFKFARAASAHAAQFVGNEASFPSLDQVLHAMNTFPESTAR